MTEELCGYSAVYARRYVRTRIKLSREPASVDDVSA
jgi:hypothetical protein